jgi:hypothetical protein
VSKEELLPAYMEELRVLKEKMLNAQKFAERFPAFSEKILANKFTHEFTGQIADSYKGLYFGWGIKRWFYREKQNIINFHGCLEPQYLWNIYINQVSLFDQYRDTGLYDIARSIDLFFFDHLNTTFYATDDQLIPLLDALADWYGKAKLINEEHRKEEKRRKLLEQLEALK